MKKYLNWNKNTGEYIQLERHIESIFIKLLNSSSTSKDNWIFPYFKVEYSNGAPFMDGNPIFSAKDLHQKKIIKIIIDDEQENIADFEGSFDDSFLYTIISPIKSIEDIDVLIKDFLLLK
ncbi:hypothetical protein CO608_00010 [Lysobacteraceae bacterium NML08-0793]|nr:hypothetical protein CO608_00010 [Xanthomonadaceae bacterium NML08-0793]